MGRPRMVPGSFFQLCFLVGILAACEAIECKWAYAAPELGTSRLLIYDGKPPPASHNGGVSSLAPVAWANFRDDIQNNGWAYLEVESSPNVTDEVQAYAAGALEAYLTRYLMEAQWENMFAHYCDNQTKFCAKLYDFLQKNLDYSYFNEKRLKDSDLYWNMVHLQMRQLQGLSDAFENATLDTSRELTNVTRALFLSLVGDFIDLEPAFQRTEDANSLSLVPACSALVKVLRNNTDLYVGHDTWFLYKSMLRIQKKYTFPWHYAPDTTGPDDIIPGHTITMSSYPGKLVSSDDFYLTSAGLAVMETSIENSNPDLWLLLDPEAAPLTWVRAMVATRLATSGREWVDIFAKKNSGTTPARNARFIRNKVSFVPRISQARIRTNPSALSAERLMITKTRVANERKTREEMVLCEMAPLSPVESIVTAIVDSPRTDGYGTPAPKVEISAHGNEAENLCHSHHDLNITKGGRDPQQLVTGEIMERQPSLETSCDDQVHPLESSRITYPSAQDESRWLLHRQARVVLNDQCLKVEDYSSSQGLSAGFDVATHHLGQERIELTSRKHVCLICANNVSSDHLARELRAPKEATGEDERSNLIGNSQSTK
ncbi:hypothetical protein HPB52_023233 [Rhipicephalus sanguineus]|uniref:Phospholipase B-like n=1 Tax=Rhipicephalus sanguineus TaxID=34632 RepID=A0A9D4T6W4_RHISA|nr:hypothetical protein HPB52_023233 [Rhipicephalus sanguineus]